MSIYKKSGKYVVKVCINGKQILRRKYLGRTILDKDTALACEKDLYISYGELQKDYVINDLFNLYEEYLFKKYKETSAKRYLNSFNLVVKKYFVDRKVSNITRSYCEFLNDSLNNLSYKAVEPYIFLAKSFLTFLSNYGCKINTNIFFKYKKSITKRVKYNFYTIEDFKKLIDVIDNTQDKLIFSLLFYYGLRDGELRALKVSSFMDEKIFIEYELSNKGRFGGQQLFNAKTSSSIRFYPYVKDIKELFLRLKKEKNLKANDFIFINKTNNKVIGETTIRRNLTKYSEKAGLHYIKIHEFRHSCATYLINKNVDPKDIASWLGHSSVDTTLRVYAHLLPVRKEKVKNVIDEEK